MYIHHRNIYQLVSSFFRSNWFPVLLFMATAIGVWQQLGDAPAEKKNLPLSPLTAVEWQAPDINNLGNNPLAPMIQYGRQLIAHTATYLGPKGTVAAITNGMNCQNCHVDAGAKLYGNCLAAVAATYPQFKPRSGRIESIEFRINDCLQRSLNGKMIDSQSKEMQAMVLYINWLGKNVPKNTQLAGTGLTDLAFMDRAASTTKGEQIYAQQCSRCHGAAGEGQPNYDSSSYIYPPLWGMHSYNTGAGLYRLSKLAAYVKDNMPYGIATHEQPQLSNEEAWDLAAFINSQPRPDKKFTEDWPDITKKAFDYPFGPYIDGFSEQQHKYGPFEPIKKARSATLSKQK